jgi:hypothetical protein
MSRASTKYDLIAAANEQFNKLWKLIDSMSEEEQNATFNFGDNFNKKEAHWDRDKNLRDVLVHLYEWHQLLLNGLMQTGTVKLRHFYLSHITGKHMGR